LRRDTTIVSGEDVLATTARNFAGFLALAAVALSTTACSRIRGHQGYIADTTLVDSIQPGVDNRDSVEKTLGRPSFISQFGAQDWYYVARETRQLAFASPSASAQLVLRVRFDAAGNVVAVEKSGMEKIAKINPDGDKTPTLGRNRSFFEDLFGNIGAVGTGGGAGQAGDGPN
jgi:outer membrane protein assembly factor BamE (lipoprotein component of BamABCDE complex)